MAEKETRIWRVQVTPEASEAYAAGTLPELCRRAIYSEGRSAVEDSAMSGVGGWITIRTDGIEYLADGMTDSELAVPGGYPAALAADPIPIIGNPRPIDPGEIPGGLPEATRGWAITVPGC